MIPRLIQVDYRHCRIVIDGVEVTWPVSDQVLVDPPEKGGVPGLWVKLLAERIELIGDCDGGFGDVQVRP